MQKKKKSAKHNKKLLIILQNVFSNQMCLSVLWLQINHKSQPIRRVCVSGV